jgi:hypothetical protein
VKSATADKDGNGAFDPMGCLWFISCLRFEILQQMDPTTLEISSDRDGYPGQEFFPLCQPDDTALDGGRDVAVCLAGAGVCI